MSAPASPAPPVPPDVQALLRLAPALARLRDARVVVKVGGSIQDQPAVMRALMGEVAALALAGAQVCVVHGGGKAITSAMSEAGLAARFVQGQRYTDAPTLRLAERVLALRVNLELVGYLNEHGVPGAALHSLGTCVLRARRSVASDPALDLGLVGEVVDVDAPVIDALMASGRVPVVAPIALDLAASEPDCEGPGKLNVNADLAAGAVSEALKPSAFVLVSDTPGVRVDATTYVRTLARPRIEELRRAGAIDGGMLPKIRATERALDAGVAHVWIVDGRVPGALLAALLSPDEIGVGTRIVA